MADNSVLNNGAGGDTYASNDIAGVKYQRVKVALGAAGTAVDAIAGNGTVTTGTQRVTLASDSTGQVTLAAGAAVIGHVIVDANAGVQIGDVKVNNATGASSVPVQGAAASGAAKAGNPVQIGGVFNTTQPTVTTGQSVELQATARGALIVSSGADTINVAVTSAPTTAVTEATLDAALIAQEAATSGVKGITLFGAVTTAKPTYTTAKSDALSLDVNGLLRVSWADSPVNAVKLLVTPDSVALPANQSVNVAQINGVAPLMGVGATGTGAQRVVQANDAGKTLVSTGGSVASSGNNTLIAAGTNKLKVYAFSLSTTSTTAVTAIFQSGASGTELWRVVLQAPASVSTGANLAVSPPAWLFATAAATLLNLNLSAAVTVHWSASYYEET